ncbi:MAG TPA: hypothetical protein VFF70_15095 [Anaerolineae bacterium]|nr:hypothetical protein [Anaerolineae bacterium]
MGNRIGITQTVSNVSVNRGLFTAQLNVGNQFGDTAFNGEARWLSIAVRCPTGGTYTPLNPRQPLTSLPYALPGLRTFPNATSPNVVGGFSGHIILASVVGGVIGGGGLSGFPNRVRAYYASIGGGYANIASGYEANVDGGASNTASGFAATVGGGSYITASGTIATVGGGQFNTASNAETTVGGGFYNTASGNAATVGGGYTTPPATLKPPSAGASTTPPAVLPPPSAGANSTPPAALPPPSAGAT